MSGINSAAPILVRATSKSNGITACVLGGSGLLLSAFWLKYMPEWLFLAGIFLTSASIVSLLIGWFKIREPQYSIEISPEEIRYHHRLGNWFLHWDNIQRIDCPRVQQGLEHVELEAVGIKIINYADFLRTISPRLATHLLMEQRPLLMHSKEESCATGGCYNHTMFDDKQFSTPEGETFTGVKAMLANRMQTLRASLGYDIYISAADIDRDPPAFVVLLRECQQARLLSVE
ncbi:DUF2982 domain-containing protein [Aestuariibacter sp. A3R04]|uniref:DUF2982 domain-containing protein n=1 Tax=Aestuariibacter sp. A3R04 TaxID=2841571 RepID=UPI001C09782F|nr:DUF2982 domain-containing protein [Aestuariibacter sp. A3R04]MBU3020780.1 DUF2982 domain-containing protein [Aestuariibacter sp. A3R04]